MGLLSYFQKATKGRVKCTDPQHRPAKCGIYVQRLSPKTWETLAYQTDLNPDDFQEAQAENQLVSPGSFGEALGAGYILSSLDGMQNLAWYDIWQNSTRNFQLHFYYEGQIPYYFEFHPQGLYLLIAPEGTATKPDPEDPEDSLLFDLKHYLKDWRLKRIKYKVNQFNEHGECNGDGGHPEWLFNG